MSKRERIALLCILAFAALLRFWSLTGPDILTDDAIYSFRAVGYFDWAASLDTQTTPVVWFPEPQWWQHLSFHDAPPLVFAVQWLFFQIFGVSLLAARLPFVLAGLFSIFGLFLLGREIGGTRAGLVAASALSILNYHIWISRIGFLDGFVVLWIIFSILFFLKSRETPIHYLSWWIFCALGLLTKYTFLFLGPTYLLFLIFFRRSAFRKRWFWIGLAVFIVLLSPVIIYNIMVWKARGHFDAALSTLVGLHPEDYMILTRQVRTDPLGFLGVIRTIFREMSAGIQSLFVLSFVFLLYRAKRDQSRRQILLLLFLGIFWGIIMLVAVGGSDRFAVVLLPFIVLFVASAGWWAWEHVPGKWRLGVLFVGGILAAWETVFAVQTQLIPEPIIKHPLLFTTHRPVWAGYNAIDDYIKSFYARFPDPNYVVFASTPQIKDYKTNVIRSFYTQGERPQQKHLLVYDDRIEWFASVWLFERPRLYEARAIASLSNLIEAIRENYVYKFREFGFEDAYVITVTDRIFHDETIMNREAIEAFAKELETKAELADEIRNYKGDVIFKVFRLSLNGY